MATKRPKTKAPVHVLLRLDPTFHRQLKRQAAAEDRPMSFLIRAALRDYLEARSA